MPQWSHYSCFSTALRPFLDRKGTKRKPSENQILFYLWRNSLATYQTRTFLQTPLPPPHKQTCSCFPLASSPFHVWKGLTGCQQPCALQWMDLTPLSNIKVSFYFHLIKISYNSTSALTKTFLPSSLKGSRMFSCSVIWTTGRERDRRLPQDIISEDTESGTWNVSERIIRAQTELRHIQSELCTHRNYAAKKNSIFHCESQQNHEHLTQGPALTLNRLRESFWARGLTRPTASCLPSPAPPAPLAPASWTGPGAALGAAELGPTCSRDLGLEACVASLPRRSVSRTAAAD